MATKTDSAVAVVAPMSGAMVIDQETRDFIRSVYAPGATEVEFQRFIAEAQHWDLDPVLREIWFIPSFGQNSPAIVMPSINGYRKMADLTGLLDGTVGPEYCGPDAVWTDVWLEDAPPAAARFTVWRTDRRYPTVATVTWKQRARRTSGGGLMNKWATTPAEMLGINAERDAWKRSGLCHQGQRPVLRADQDPHLEALRRVHAVADANMIGHAEVKQILTGIDPEATSLADLPTDDLHMAADLIEAVGASVVPTETASAEVQTVKKQREAFIGAIQRTIGTKMDKDQKLRAWSALMERAGYVSGGWQLLIENAPSLAYGRTLAGKAVAAGVRQQDADACLQFLADKFQVKEPQPPVEERAPSAPVDSSPAAAKPVETWEEAWQIFRALGVADAEQFGEIVGTRPAELTNDPQEALNRLRAALAGNDGVEGAEDAFDAAAATQDADGADYADYTDLPV